MQNQAENRNGEKADRNTGTANAEMEQGYTTDKTDIFGIGITTKGRIERCVL